MPRSTRPRSPRSLLLLRKRCADIFREERTLIASEGPILITRKGNPYSGNYRLFPIPYEILSERSYNYLWEELRRIEWGIEAEGYTNKELDELRAAMDEMEVALSRIIPRFDLANCAVLKQLNLLN